MRPLRQSRGLLLTLEQVMKYDIEGQEIEFRSSVIRVGNEPPPADAIGIPAGARQIESRSAAVSRELEFNECFGWRMM